MATLVVQQQSAFRSSTPPPLCSLSLDTGRSRTPVPNKHLPYCPPGPVPSSTQTLTPPNSPPQKSLAPKPTTVLYPPYEHQRLLNSPPIYGISAHTLSQAINQLAAQQLPHPSQVFPWLHGLHPDNHIQLAFFVARKKALRKVPRCVRGLTIIKAGGDLTRARIKGAVAPDEVLCLNDGTSKGFVDSDPREGFSVRNFHIQVAKMAQVSDIVVYGDEKTDHRIIRSVAERAASVQRKTRRDLENSGQVPETYNTFVLLCPFEDLEEAYPDLVATDSSGRASDGVIDFLQWERREMCEMSKASEISKGVFQGPSPGLNTMCPDGDDSAFDLYVECSDHATMPDDKILKTKQKQMETRQDGDPVYIAFPSSGSILPPSWSQTEVNGILTMCRWLHSMTKGAVVTATARDEDGDIQMAELTPRPRKILLHCADGYTETSLLTIAYTMFAEGIPLHEAWLRLHCEKKRNFFAYPSDVALLASIQDRLLDASPSMPEMRLPSPTPDWLDRFDGSLPSRVLPYMYLGNLTHANNPTLLRKLGITRVLSVGEPVAWSKEDLQGWGRDNLLMVNGVQDNGIDELMHELERCLDFIGQGKADGTATLVHCRVGVSRSATICIAEVMASQKLCFARAYCFVRARRLNVIIQPHLRFVYELMRWDEIQQERRGEKIKRELEWATVAREIAAMNRPYTRS